MHSPAIRCISGAAAATDHSKLLKSRNSAMTSSKVKDHGSWPSPNYTEYEVPRPRPLKPPWSPHQSTFANNNSKAFQLCWIFAFKMVPDWSHCASIAPPWTNASNIPFCEIPNFFAGDPPQQLFLEPGHHDALTLLETPRTSTSTTTSIFNSSSTTQDSRKPASNRKRHAPAEMDSEPALKRQTLCQASRTCASGALISPSSDLSTEVNQGLVLDSSGDSTSENCDTFFPCPFYFQNPEKYTTKAFKACTGPAGLGWKGIHRLKYVGMRTRPVR
jgi:hypothetical protein